MISGLWLLGFFIAAFIGAVATAATPAQLRREAALWADGKRRLAWGTPNFLKALLGLLSIEILFLCGITWLVGLALICAFAYPREYLDYVFGSMVGGAAAPWLWLHFTRTFDSQRRGPAPRAQPAVGPDASTDSADNKETDASDDNIEFARYRFTTYLLAIAIVVAILQPYLGKWLSRVQTVQALSVALTLSQPRDERGTSLQNPAGNGPSSEKDSAHQLSAATMRAYLVANGVLEGDRGKTLSDIKSDMQGFGELSIIDRDKAYIAYFYYEMTREGRAKRRTGELPEKATLDQYVSGGLPPSANSDPALLKRLEPISKCVSFYAEQLRDFRLFLLDSGGFLRPLLVSVAGQWDLKHPANKDPKKLDEIFEHRELERFLGQVGSSSKDPRCTDILKDVESDKPIDIAKVARTPYAADFIAHYLAAIDSVESGVVVMTDWLQYQSARSQDAGMPNGPEKDWYTVRAMLTASQLPYRFGGIAPTHAAQVRFQEQTTDRMAKLLGLGGARTWRSFCHHLKRPGLHALVGRHLAFTYADERNYLFELVGPEDFGSPLSDSALPGTKTALREFLDEAEAMIAEPDCFAGVPRFSEERQKLIALYYVNTAYLRYWLRASAGEKEKAELTRRIRQDLDRAKQLGKATDDPNSFDLLRRADEFERHRVRRARLLQALDDEKEKE